MAIRNVESILADKPYIRALEQELAELRQMNEQLAAQITNLMRGTR